MTPTDNILQIAAAALTKGQVPDFSGLASSEVAAAFASGWSGPFGPDDAFATKLSDLITAESAGTVSVSEPPVDDLAFFAPMPKGPRLALTVTGPGWDRRVIIVPAYPPVLLRDAD